MAALPRAPSSRCIEDNLIQQADRVRANERSLCLLHSQGSPFIDLSLPRGGAIAVILGLVRDFDRLATLFHARVGCCQVSLTLSPESRLSVGARAEIKGHLEFMSFSGCGLGTGRLGTGMIPPVGSLVR